MVIDRYFKFYFIEFLMLKLVSNEIDIEKKNNLNKDFLSNKD